MGVFGARVALKEMFFALDLGMVLRRLGQIEEAEKDWLRMSPSSIKCEESMRRLKLRPRLESSDGVSSES